MQPFYRYPTQPQHPMQPFQVNPHMQNMNGMHGMPRHAGSVDRFLGTIGSGGSITGGTSIFTMLNNVQKVLKVAETMGPMIKQYGPAMRNLPSIMTALKDFQNGGSETKAENSPEADTSKKAENNDKIAEVEENTEPKEKKKEKRKKETEEKVTVSGPKSSKTTKQQAQKLKKAPANTKLVPAAPKTNLPKGYHLSGPKLYV
ncbi:YqfQ-like protein [Fictibacillus sp. BK138]|nr:MULTISPECIES: VrrA/YqfQ family protein [Fictibacillus]RZT22329.1 YqfQ-like protein [Fictibacillus sp. BK138]